MSNIPKSSLTLFNLAIDPWPFSLSDQFLLFFLSKLSQTRSIISRLSMRSGIKQHHHHHLNFHVLMHFLFHLHHNHHSKEEFRDTVPRGCVTVLVGQGEEQQQKFVIPVMHINHPLFSQLLKEAEQVYGFHHNGPLNIPCHVEEFRYVEGMIDKDVHHNHTYHNHLCCFEA